MRLPTPGQPTHHMLRRTARKTRNAYNLVPNVRYVAKVVPAGRGPWRYRVELHLRPSVRGRRS